jgi:hypothetical protein
MTLTRDDKEIAVTVDFHDWPATRGARSSLGVPEEPDEKGGVEIDEVYDAKTKEKIVLTDEEIEELERQIVDGAE